MGAGAWAGCMRVAATAGTGHVVKERRQAASGKELAVWVGEASAGYTAEKAAAGGFAKGSVWRLCREICIALQPAKGGKGAACPAVPTAGSTRVAASPVGCGPRSSLQSIPSHTGFSFAC